MWDPEDEFRGKLGPDEQLLWVGCPPAGLRFRFGDVFFIPFSLLWCGFAIFWTFSAFSMGAPWFFVLWGTPFILVGLYMVVGRFFVDALVRSNTAYAVTNERIIIQSGLLVRRQTSFNLDTLSDLSLTEYGDGGGVIVFGMGLFMDQRQRWVWQSMGPPSRIPAFELPTGARHVYQLIRDAQRAAKRAAHDPDTDLRDDLPPQPPDERIRGDLA